MNEIILELLKQRNELNIRLEREIYNESSYIDEAQRAVDNFDKSYGHVIATAALGGTATSVLKNVNES